MKLTVVGCSGSGPGPSRRRPATWSSTTASGCCSTSATARSGRCRAARPGDHRRGLPLPPARRPLPRRRAVRRLAPLLRPVGAGRVPLYAPVGAERRLALAYDDDGAALTDVFDFVPVGPGSFALGPFEVTLARTAHPVECYAIRLERRRPVAGLHRRHRPVRARGRARPRGRRAARRGGPPARSRPALPACTSPGREAGEHAAGRGVGRLLLTHVPSWVDEIGQLFAGERGLPRDRAGARRRDLRDLRTRWMAEEERDGVRLTSLDQPLGDDLEVTKGDLVDYLDAVADRIVPLLAGRPLSVKRVRPGQPPFMQKNVFKGAPTGCGPRRLVGGVAPRDRPGALRRPADAAVAGQPARRRVPRPFFRIGDDGADRPGARPRPAGGRRLLDRGQAAPAGPAGARGRRASRAR